MSKKENYNIQLKELINKKQNTIKEFTIVLNNNKPIFTKKDYETIEGEPLYFDLD